QEAAVCEVTGSPDGRCWGRGLCWTLTLGARQGATLHLETFHRVCTHEVIDAGLALLFLGLPAVNERRVPMRSSTLVLLFLISVQAVLYMGGEAQAQDRREAGTDRAAGHSRTAAGLTASSPGGTASAGQSHQDSHSHSIPTVDPKLFTKRRYRSPRVLFSVLPPDSDEGMARMGGPGAGAGAGSRVRRRASQPLHRGEYSVCDSISQWVGVGNKTKATDIRGKEVTVLPDVNINNVIKKQFFFETTCRSSTSRSGSGAVGGSASGCRGIDSRHWNSYCTNTHTYVRALTTYENIVAFRLIRINAACVCVLSRKSWRH
ncbi:hypothetical protein JZ751_003442, partial [Albula glossodonta]